MRSQEEVYDRRYGRGEPAKEHCNTTKAQHWEWWVPGSVGTTRRGSVHIDTRSAGSPGAAVVHRSRVGREGRWDRAQRRLLLKHLVLERVALDTHNPTRCPGEEPVKLRQELVVAG